MPMSTEMRQLKTKWLAGASWPQRLEWIEINRIRGWSGQRVDFDFPIVAIVGENGAGKSTVLQAAASVYRNPTKERYASDFFPDTPYEKTTNATIRFGYKQGPNFLDRDVRKPTNRWRGNPERPARRVEYVDLARIQPVGARVGYARLLKAEEGQYAPFDAAKLGRLTSIIGKTYTAAGISVTNAGDDKPIPVLELDGNRYSGFHQGAGEIAAAELLAVDYPQYGLVLIDEIETSLHPRAQRRLMRDLARIARTQELQIILTTHSPYILEELPAEARIYLMKGADGLSVVTGVSPDFAMTRMDDVAHPECDVYVEDKRAVVLVTELMARADRPLLSRLAIQPYGTASVGKSLGQMVEKEMFPRPTVVFLDGDQDGAPGCQVLPGGDAPEIFVFHQLQATNWEGVSARISRGAAETIDALNAAMLSGDHHGWLNHAGDALVMGADVLWQGMVVAWVHSVATQAEVDAVNDPIAAALA